MNRDELFSIILVSLIYCATCHGSTSLTDDITNNKDKPPDKIVLQKSQPYDQDQQSFMSKIVTWILPFSERRDSFVGPQYIPQSQSHIQKDCNACNQEPWVPISSSVGEKTVINFVPPVNNFGHSSVRYPDSSLLETLHPPPVTYNAPIRHYSPVPQFRPKDQNYLTKYQPQPDLQKYALVDYMLPPPVSYRIPSSIYGPPSQINNPPVKPVYGPPNQPFNPPVKPVYGPPNQPFNPPVKPVYGPPSQPFNPPKPLYGPPNQPDNALPNTLYGPPKPVYQPFGPTGYNNQYPQAFISPPPLPNNIPQNPDTTYLTPVVQNYKPSPITHLSDQYNGFDEAVTDKNIQVFPSDSYGAPVTGDTLNYFSPHEQLSSANEQKEYLERPIPLPNLSSYPVLPFRNYVDFNQNRVGVQYNDNTEVKIQESVKVADYLASIEHPIDVIQSPLIELSIKDDGIDESGKAYESNGPENSNTVDSTDQYNREEKTQKQYENVKELQNYEASSTKLSENPIVVEDIHAAASNNNDTFVNSNEVHIKRSNDQDLVTPNQLEHVNGANIIKDLLLHRKTPNTDRNGNHPNAKYNFTTPNFDYSSWTPTYGVTMSSLKILNYHNVPSIKTTKKPKVLQIIVPYVSSKNSRPFEKHSPQNVNYNGAYTTLVPVFTPPPTAQVSDWVKFMASESEQVTVTARPKVTTGVYNIRDLLSNRTEHRFTETLPFDIISLQKHIDDWTQQAYSKDAERAKEKLSTPKEIPRGYFTTQTPEVHTEAVMKKETPETKALYTDIETNLIQPVKTTTEKKETTTKKPVHDKASWNVSHVTVSPQTKEKVYVVTPQLYNFFTSTPATAWSTAPKIENGKVNNGSTFDSYKFSIRVEPQKESKNNSRTGKDVVKVVYSEWPHLINNLQTTTKKPASRHPLFGLMDIPSYTPSPNSTVETIYGHSRVTLAVTPATVPEVGTRKTTDVSS